MGSHPAAAPGGRREKTDSQSDKESDRFSTATRASLAMIPEVNHGPASAKALRPGGGAKDAERQSGNRNGTPDQTQTGLRQSAAARWGREGRRAAQPQPRIEDIGWRIEVAPMVFVFSATFASLWFTGSFAVVPVLSASS